MELIFRKLDDKNPKDVEQFNELMGELMEPANSIEVLTENIKKANLQENYFLLVAINSIIRRLLWVIEK